MRSGVPEFTGLQSRATTFDVIPSITLRVISLVAEWIHFTLFVIISPTIQLKVYTLGGL